MPCFLKIILSLPSYGQHQPDHISKLLKSTRCVIFGTPTVCGSSVPEASELQNILRSKSTNYINGNDPIPKMYPGVPLNEFLDGVRKYAATPLEGSFVMSMLLCSLLEQTKEKLMEDAAFNLAANEAKMYQHMCESQHLGIARPPEAPSCHTDFSDHDINTYVRNLRLHAELVSVGVNPSSLPAFRHDVGLQDAFREAMSEMGRTLHFIINIIGERGEGKSTLINSLRGLNWGNPEHRKLGAAHHRTGRIQP